MKKMLSLLIVMVLISGLFAENIRINNQNNEVKVLSSTEEQVVLEFTAGNFDKNTVVINSEIYNFVNLKGESKIYEKGNPSLPKAVRSIVIGDDAKIEFDVVESNYVEYQMNIAPSKGMLSREIDPATIPYEFSKAYQTDNFFPGNLVSSNDPYIMRDVRGIAVTINPFQYNPVTKTLRVYTHIVVEANNVGVDNINVKTRNNNTYNKYFSDLYNSHFINFGMNNRYDSVDEHGRIIVICYAGFMDAMSPYVEWKNQKGIRTEIYDVTNIGNTANSIKSFIQSEYNANDDLTFVQLIGDINQIASFTSGGGASDPKYALLEGNDSYPDLFVGRFSAENIAQVETQVERTVHYEKEIVDGEWLSKGFGIASAQGAGSGHNGEADYVHIGYIRDDLLAYGYSEVDEIYDTNGGNATQVANAINEGRGIGNYCGHGSNTSWASTGFSNNHVNQLTNDYMLPYINSIACVNGNFAGITCFAEAWLRATNNTTGAPTGAVAMYASSINQSWAPPMEAQDEYVDLLIAEEKNSIGGLYYNGACLMLDVFNAVDMYETWHIFGDASLQVRTKVPEIIIANHLPTMLLGMDTFDVSTGFEDALVCLTYNGEILGSGYTDASGNISLSLENVPNNPSDLTLTITGYNKVANISTIQLLPANGAYIVTLDSEIDDSQGNNNGNADYGELIGLSLEMQNVGTDPTNNLMVTISTTDEYITITDDSEAYGIVDPDQIISITNGFEFQVEDLVPDGHVAIITVVANDGTNEWTSQISGPLHAPVLEFVAVEVNDASGNNNGKLDPGETVLMEVEITNSGSSDAFDVNGFLNSTSQYIDVTSDEDLFGDIASGNNGFATFEIAVDINTPAGHIADFLVQFEAENGTSGSGEFNQVVGQIPVIIVDFDENNNSAPAIENALTAIGIPSEYATSLPADLNLYSSIFVCLGIYSDNHVLTDAEGSSLSDYLNNGGNLYMEGGDTWYYDNQTAVHEMFGLNGTTDGSSDLGTVNGLAGTFTEGMSFNYSGDNAWIDHLEATTGEMILENQNPNYGCMISNDGGNYKTIGASLEFGGLDDGNTPSTKTELMAGMMELFGLFVSDNPHIEVSTTEINEELFPNQTSVQSLTIENTGGGDLVFTIEISDSDVVVAYSNVENQTRNAISKEKTVNYRTEWLSADILSGTIAPGESMDINFEFDTTDMIAGDYSADINISSNDTFNPIVLIEANLEVLQPQLAEITLSDVTAGIGEDITISVNTSELIEDDNIIAYQFEMMFDDTIIEYLGYSIDGTIAEGGMVAIQAPANNQINVGYMTITPIVGEGSIIDLQFHTLATGVTQLVVEDFLFNTTQITGIYGGLIVVTGGYTYGDVDANGTVQAFDASLTLQNAVGLISFTPEQSTIADVDGNELIQAYDASLILQYAVGLITIFPVEEARSIIAPVADVTVSVENSELVFSTKGNLFGFEVSVDEALTLDIPTTDMLLEMNENTIAVASAEAVSGEFLRIPFSMEKEIDAKLNLVINTEIKEEIIAYNILAGDVVSFNQVLGNYPNPFNPTTSIQLLLKEDTDVTISIYNVKGSLVKNLQQGLLNSGLNSIQWNGLDNNNNKVGSGVYFYQVQMGNEIVNDKMLLLK